MTLEQLDHISVADYLEQFGGWPVYGAHAETCHEGRNSSTLDGRHDAESEVAAALVRRSGTGGVELFIPKPCQIGTREMQESLQKVFNNIQFK